MADTRKKSGGDDGPSTPPPTATTRGEKTWQERFLQLKQYKVKHGHPNPDPTKRRGVDREEYKLALWLDSQRNKSREGVLELQLAQKLVFLGCKSIDIHLLAKKLTPQKVQEQNKIIRKKNNPNPLPPPKKKRSRSPSPGEDDEEDDDGGGYYKKPYNRKRSRPGDDEDDDDDDDDDDEEEEEEPDMEEEYVPEKRTFKKKKKRVYYGGGGGGTYESGTTNRKRVSWETRFDELVAFNAKHGHANPKYGKDKPLAQWLSNQRSDYRCGKRKKLTEEKIQKLRDLGATGFGND